MNHQKRCWQPLVISKSDSAQYSLGQNLGKTPELPSTLKCQKQQRSLSGGEF
jgi:hypothetical protein